MKKRFAVAAGWMGRFGRAAPGWIVRAVGAGWTLGAQLAGTVSAVAGLYVLLGLGATLLIGGVALLAVGTLAEMAGPRKRGA